MTITVIEFPTQYGMKRIEVSEKFLTDVKTLLAEKGILSIEGIRIMVTGYDRIKRLPSNDMKFEYGDEDYSGEVCCFGFVMLDGKLDYILCEDDKSEAILATIFN